jgi:hypothetical protein
MGQQFCQHFPTLWIPSNFTYIGLSTYPLVIKHDWNIFHDWFGDFPSYKPNQLEKGMSQLTHRLLRLFPGPNASVAARHLDAWRQLAGGKILQSISKIWWMKGFPWYIPSQFPTWHHLDSLVGWFPWTVVSPPSEVGASGRAKDANGGGSWGNGTGNSALVSAWVELW